MIEGSSGRIMIDQYNIHHLSLFTLRNSISIVPQIPTLFHGTIRYNLDPCNQFNDEYLWQCLEKCQLKKIIFKKKKQLYSTVEVGGINWSVGQRQLICLARALVKESKILILDECSASVDSKTDQLLQMMIRKEFQKCNTVLNII
jgi:ATP-binding cassette subfamily C (CFTR/MRP) protein 2